MKRFKTNTFAFFVSCGLLAFSVNSAYSTGFNNGISGKKTVVLNNKVSDNQIKFYSKAPAEDIEGAANGIDGSFIIDPSNVEATTGTFTVAIKSMKSGIEMRDKHMQGPEWLGADKNPDIKYVVTKIIDVQTVSSDKGKAVVKGIAVGNFFLNGVAKEIKAPVTITYVPESDATRKKADGDFVMVQTEFKVVLKDFNIAGKKGMVGSKVGDTIDIKANLYGATK
ncbi:MAG: YceI family protein [Bacteroidota bacterium]